MMKTLLAALTLTLAALNGNAQLISQFTWEGADPKVAIAGPNATSISSSAVISTGGAAGTNGLNAGTPTADLNLVIPGATFKVASIDMSFDFKRKETDAVFFTLGSFDFGEDGGNLHAKFLIKKAGVDTLITLKNLYALPGDNAFHTYRFLYDAVSGLATVYADGNTVGRYQAPASTSLSWNGATDVTVGKIMDGTGSNIAILDNMIVRNPLGFSTLPVRLESFEAANAGSANKLNWTAGNDNTLSAFGIQRSTDGLNFETIDAIGAAQSKNYQYIDNNPAPTSFYRLRMTDADGAVTYSGIKKITLDATTEAISITAYPNPVINYVNIKAANTAPQTFHYAVATIDGRILQSGAWEVAGSQQQLSLNLTSAPKGILLIILESNNNRQTMKIFKR
jgi:hypothetical protein